MKTPFKCPKCGATPNKHGKGECADRVSYREHSVCLGCICECAEDDNDSEAEGHGESFENPCPNAVCAHCGWGGTLPVKPKGLQTWEKKALEAGWTPPANRKKELGL